MTVSVSETTEPAYHGIAAVLLMLRHVLEDSGLTCSEYVIDASGNTPSHLIDDTFSMAYTTRNTGLYRGVTPLRMGHTVTVTTVGRLNGSNAFDDMIAHSARSERLIRAIHLQSRTIEVRATLDTITPSLSPSREFLITQIAINVEHDWFGEPLE